jgi:pimeloyl-ACP methyl ester carboxylesterase
MRIVKIVLAALLLVVVVAAGFVYLFPEKATQLAVDSERGRAGLVRKEVDLPDGLHYVYLDGGQGEPLMLLHGFGANKDNFLRVAKFLTPQYRLIIPDHIGFGESSHPAEADYSSAAQAQRLKALTRALGIGRLHLGGNSMGGQIAMTFAALYPNDVVSLWLLDPAGIWSAPPSELANRVTKSKGNPMLIKSEEDFAKLISFVMTDPPFIPPPMRNVLARERINNYDLETRIFDQIRADSVETRVSGLATPTLIVWGDQDRAISVATADILHKLLPNSRVIILHGVGHLPMLERSRHSADDYLRFRGSLAHGVAQR